MTEGVMGIPDEAPLSDKDLDDGVRNSLRELLAFVQNNDGFLNDWSRGGFRFFDNGVEYSGTYKYQSSSGGVEKERIDITRRGDGVYDRSVVRSNPMNKQMPLLITYYNLATGDAMKPNTHGALRGTQNITRPPALQPQVV